MQRNGLSMFYVHVECDAATAHRDQDASAAIVKVPWEGHCQEGSCIGTVRVIKGRQKKNIINFLLPLENACGFGNMEKGVCLKIIIINIIEASKYDKLWQQ